MRVNEKDRYCQQLLLDEELPLENIAKTSVITNRFMHAFNMRTKVFERPPQCVRRRQ